MGKQPTMGQKKSKEAIARAAAASRKGQKKKWSKGKVAEKRNYEVLVTKGMLKDMEKEIPRMRLVTIHTVSDRFKVVASTAKRIIRHFAEQGKIEALTF
jgi:small subunit ribosomal protein S25e